MTKQQNDIATDLFENFAKNEGDFHNFNNNVDNIASFEHLELKNGEIKFEIIMGGMMNRIAWNDLRINGVKKDFLLLALSEVNNQPVSSFLAEKIEKYVKGDLVVFSKNGKNKLRIINWQEDESTFSVSPIASHDDLASGIIEYADIKELKYYNKLNKLGKQTKAHLLHRTLSEAKRTNQKNWYEILNAKYNEIVN